ncbi:hypothetical protein ACFWGR_29075 [Streptomyces sp. NPDC060311]|uniref:hypothetical protein n=1 Tax=Streptomyces sp. NPDC060311 TaxID=3347096 RepID=UPI00364A5DC8
MGAVPEDSGGESVVRRLAGRDRRCTADPPDGALVSPWRGCGAVGGTGVTRTPRADRAGGVLAGAPDDGAGAAPVERAARCTGGVAVDAGCGAGAGADASRRVRDVRGCAPEAEVRVGATEPVGALGAPVSEVSAGIARRGATGIRWTGGGPDGGARRVEDG